jgi:predicted transporter
MRKRAILLGVSALLLGLLLVFSAFVFWTVNGLTVLDTPDGKPSGPLHGYGVTTILLLAAFGSFYFGGRRLTTARSRSDQPTSR